MPKSLAEKIKKLPQKPGVYIFKDAKGLILYVGKAIKLKNRVTSYFHQDAGEGSSRIQHMISRIADLDFVVTDNEVESLVLENNFIKQLQPKYNVRLRDDKNYLFIKINLGQEIPTIGLERKLADRSARYFGPYTSSQSVKETLRLIRKIFPYCSNSKVGNRPCFYFHIGKCLGVCIGKISLAEYRATINKIISLLDSRQTTVIKQLQRQMKQEAFKKHFEKAAKIRDQIFALNRVLERQKLVYPKRVDQDVFSLYQDSVAVINLFVIRAGKLIGKENFILENTKQTGKKEILESFLSRYYLEASSVPKEILLPVKIDEKELKSTFLPLVRGRLRWGHSENTKTSPHPSSRGGESPKILVPVRGHKLELIKLGMENARQYLESQSDKHLLEEARLLSSLKELERVLNLPKLPARIEAYDISNIQGTNATGSMVVFDFGRPKKEAYRRFNIGRMQRPDDFAMMKQMLERRFKYAPLPSRERLGEGQKLSKTPPLTPPQRGGEPWPLPNLILIDGGKGQLNTGLKVLQNPKFKLQIPIIGLAKRLEEIFLPGQSKPIMLPKNSIALFLLQRIRDEAHRFARAYHVKLRSNTALVSLLDQIPGIGRAKKRKLMTTFGSTANLGKAGVSEIAAVVGNKLAQKIKASL